MKRYLGDEIERQRSSTTVRPRSGRYRRAGATIHHQPMAFGRCSDFNVRLMIARRVASFSAAPDGGAEACGDERGRVRRRRGEGGEQRRHRQAAGAHVLAGRAGRRSPVAGPNTVGVSSGAGASTQVMTSLVSSAGRLAMRGTEFDKDRDREADLTANTTGTSPSTILRVAIARLDTRGYVARPSSSGHGTTCNWPGARRLDGQFAPRRLSGSRGRQGRVRGGRDLA